MLGQKTPTGKLFYQFNLEEHVPADHLLRRIVAAVDFSFVRRRTARFSSHTGQPSVDPVVLFRMALLGYLYGITSERRLVQEIGLNLAYRRFIGYDLDEAVPDHSVLSKARARFGPTVYLGFFAEIVRQGERAGLARGDKVDLDSTLVEADAGLDSLGARALVGRLPDVAGHVERLWRDNPDPTAAPGQTTLTVVLPSPAVAAPDPPAPAELPVPRRAGAGAVAPPAVAPRAPGGEVPPARSRPVGTPRDPPTKASGTFNERIASRVDPEAEVVSRARMVADLSDKVHAGVDAGRARIVTAVEVTGGATTDDQLLKRLVSEHEGNVGRRVREVSADTKDGTVENYRRLEGRGIRAAIPMADKGAAKPGLPPPAVAYDPQTDSFRCPTDQRLTRQGVLPTAAGLPITLYQARPAQCAPCPRKAEGCGTAKARSLSVADDGGVRARAALYLATSPARPSIRRRKVWIETIFGDGKEQRGRRRARWRGLDRMRIQARMTAIAQNVRHLALSKGTRPETGAGALELASPVAHSLSRHHLPLAQPACDHDPMSCLSRN